MGGAITEEQAISWAQYLDLVYSQSGTLYDLIPQAPHPSIDPTKPLVETPVDGIVGSIQSSSVENPTKQPHTSNPTPSTPKVSTEVNSIQSIQTPDKNKKKGKVKNKNPRNQQENPKPTTNDNNKGKRKAKYPCLLCGGDHFMKECPRREEINQFLKTNPAPVVLTDPFPSQQYLIDHISNQGNSSSSEKVRMMSSNTINLQTRSQSYDKPTDKK